MRLAAAPPRLLVLVGAAFWAGRMSAGAGADARGRPAGRSARARRARRLHRAAARARRGSTATSPPSSPRSSSTRSPPTTAASPAAPTPEDTRCRPLRTRSPARAGALRKASRRLHPAAGPRRRRADLRPADHRLDRPRPGGPALQRRRLHPAPLQGLRVELDAGLGRPGRQALLVPQEPAQLRLRRGRRPADGDLRQQGRHRDERSTASRRSCSTPTARRSRSSTTSSATATPPTWTPPTATAPPGGCRC